MRPSRTAFWLALATLVPLAACGRRSPAPDAPLSGPHGTAALVATPAPLATADRELAAAPGAGAKARREAPVVASPARQPVVAGGAAEARDRRVASAALAMVRAPEPLRAGATDDNADFDAFLRFVADRGEPGTAFDPLEVRERAFVRVVDGSGGPVPAASVRVLERATGRVIWTGTSHGDGRAAFYPHLAGSVTPGLVVDASIGEAQGRAEWDGRGELLVPLAGAPRAVPGRLDVAFVLDTTGSMSDEIDRIKRSLLDVTARLRAIAGQLDLRYAAILYRDRGDAYVTRAIPFTNDLASFDAALRQVVAAGGGDGPESVNRALADAIALDWREGAAKVAFLVGDAPPHLDYPNDVPYDRSALEALRRGIRVHAVAASGLETYPNGALVFRRIAQLTRGKFVFIEYGSTASSADMHGVTGAVTSNNLDEILFRQIREELEGWGRAPALQQARASVTPRRAP